MTKSLLLISEKPEDQAFAVEVALASGLSLKKVTDPLEGAKIIAGEELLAAIFADTSSEKQYQVLETAIQETVGLFSDKINANTIHFLSSENLEKVRYLIQSPLFGHFVLRNFENPKETGQHYGRIVRATLADRAFGLTQLLKTGSTVQTVQLSLSSQKQDAVEAVRGYLLAAKFQSRMASVIANAVDELLMNSIYDAPVDEQGKPILNATPRSTEMKLESQHKVEMHIGFDGDYVAITAIDYFGSLDKEKLLSHISKIYVKEEYKIRSSVAGAGLGLANVFRSGGSFFFVIQAKVKTEATVFFKKTANFRDFKDQFRFISTQFYGVAT